MYSRYKHVCPMGTNPLNESASCYIWVLIQYALTVLDCKEFIAEVKIFWPSRHISEASIVEFWIKLVLFDHKIVFPLQKRVHTHFEIYSWWSNKDISWWNLLAVVSPEILPWSLIDHLLVFKLQCLLCTMGCSTIYHWLVHLFLSLWLLFPPWVEVMWVVSLWTCNVNYSSTVSKFIVCLIDFVFHMVTERYRQCGFHDAASIWPYHNTALIFWHPSPFGSREFICIFGACISYHEFRGVPESCWSCKLKMKLS